MKWSERGPIPWPFVRRSRFVKELERQGAAYRQNVEAAQGEAAVARMRLADKEDEFRETIRHLQGYYDKEGTLNFCETRDPAGVPTHFISRGIHRDATIDALVFSVAVSRMMLERARDLRIVYETVVSDLVKGMMAEAVSPTDPFGGKT